MAVYNQKRRKRKAVSAKASGTVGKKLKRRIKPKPIRPVKKVTKPVTRLAKKFPKPRPRKPLPKTKKSSRKIVRRPSRKPVKPVARKIRRAERPSRKPVVLTKTARQARRDQAELRFRAEKLLSGSKRWTFKSLAAKLGVTQKALHQAVFTKPVKEKVVRKPTSKPVGKKPPVRPAMPKPMSRADEDRRADIIRRTTKELEKWKGGSRVLDTSRSSGHSVRFTVRRRVTSEIIESVLKKVRNITFKLEAMYPGYSQWIALYSLMVIGKRHPKLPGYDPLPVVGLGRGEEAYVTYESTGVYRAEEDMRAKLASELFAVVTSETYVTLEQVSVSVMRDKSSEERMQWFAFHNTRSRRRKRPL